MIYLKIFHKQFLLILILLLSGCISYPVIMPTTKTINENNAESTSIDSFVNENNNDIVLDVSSTSEADYIEKQLPVEILDWMVPEIEKLSTEIYLPEVIKKEIVINENKIANYVYLPAYSYNYEYAWDYLPKTVIIRELETKSEAENNVNVLFPVNKQTQEDIPNNSVEKSEANLTKIVTKQIINAAVFEKLDISLDGQGWIYLPEDSNKSIEYSGRKFTDARTIYTFIPKNEGDYILRFQYQDLSSNIFNVEEIDLKIVKIDGENLDNNAILPSVSDNINLEEAENFDLEVSVNKMIMNRDASGLALLVPDLLNSKIDSVTNKLPEIAELLYNELYFVTAASILETLILDDSITPGSDYFLYLLGKIYEKDSSLRNEKKSVEFYKTLIDNYPASIYWEDSQDRYRFLKRRYIDIR